MRTFVVYFILGLSLLGCRLNDNEIKGQLGSSKVKIPSDQIETIIGPDTISVTGPCMGLDKIVIKVPTVQEITCNESDEFTVTIPIVDIGSGTTTIDIHDEVNSTDPIGSTDVTVDPSALLASWRATLPVEFQSAQTMGETRAEYPEVAIGGANHAIIVWQQYAGRASHVYKSVYNSGTWTHPSGLNDTVSPQPGFVWEPIVAINDTGKAIILWRQSVSDNVAKHLFMSHNLSGTWTKPKSIGDPVQLADGTKVVGAAGSFSAAIGGNGDAIIAWKQDDATAVGQLFKAEYRSGSWTYPANLADNFTPDTFEAYGSAVAMNASGETLLVWSQNDGSHSQVYKAEYRSGSWTFPTGITDRLSHSGAIASFDPNGGIDIADTGDAIIVWGRQNGSGKTQAYRAHYRTGSWTYPSGVGDNMELLSSESQKYIRAAISESGRAIMTWSQSDGANDHVYKSEYNGTLWSDPGNINDYVPNSEASYCHAHVGMDAAGDAIIVWAGTGGLMKSEFRSGSWTHPSSSGDVFPGINDPFNEHRLRVSNTGEAIVTYITSPNRVMMVNYRSGSWDHPASLSDSIEPLGHYSRYQDMAINNNGQAVVTWHMKNPVSGYRAVYKSELNSGVWTHPVDLNDAVSLPGAVIYHTAPPKVAIGDNGDAVIAWNQYADAPSRRTIFIAERRSGTWSFPANNDDAIGPSIRNAHPSMDVAMNASGDTVIAWNQQADDLQQKIFMSHYKSGSWTHPSNGLDSINPGSCYETELDVDIADSGEALIVWTNTEASAPNNRHVLISEYRSGSWMHPADADSYISVAGEDSYQPKLALSSNGEHAVIAWRQSDGSNSQIYKSTYSLGGGWVHPTGVFDRASIPGTDAFEPFPTVNASGKGFLVWRQPDASHQQIYRSALNSGTWTPPGGLFDSISNNTENSYVPQIKVNDAGKAIVVWLDNHNKLTYSEYISSAWSSVDSFVNDDSTSSFTLDMNADGDINIFFKYGSSDPTKPGYGIIEYR